MADKHLCIFNYGIINREHTLERIFHNIHLPNGQQIKTIHMWKVNNYLYHCIIRGHAIWLHLAIVALKSNINNPSPGLLCVSYTMTCILIIRNLRKLNYHTKDPEKNLLGL